MAEMCKEVMMIKEMADGGDLSSMHAMYNILMHGTHNMEQDIPAAMAYLEKAAAGGHDLACYDLAKHYDKGKYVPEDREKAMEMYREALVRMQATLAEFPPEAEVERSCYQETIGEIEALLEGET